VCAAGWVSLYIRPGGGEIKSGGVIGERVGGGVVELKMIIIIIIIIIIMPSSRGTTGGDGGDGCGDGGTDEWRGGEALERARACVSRLADGTYLPDE